MITRYSKKIINWLVNHSEFSQDEEQIEVYIYGLECFFNTAITTLILMFWAIITHSAFEMLCWIVSFSTLRHHVGGLHAPTQSSCILSSSLLGISNYFILRCFKIDALDIIIIFIACTIICILYAPTDSEKLNLSPSESRKHKKIAITLLILGTLLSVILQNTISTSIMHSFFCTCLLILLKKVSDKL